MLQCGPGAYCCRPAFEARNCCDNQTARIDINIGQLILPTRTVGAGETATVTVGAGSGINGAGAGESCPKDNSAVVGGAVGGVLGAALLGTVVALVILLRRRPAGPATPAPPQYQQHTGQYAGGQYVDHAGSGANLTGGGGYAASAKYGPSTPGSGLASPQELPPVTEVYEMQGPAR